MRPNDIPESQGMICLDQVGEFVYDDVIDHEHGRFDQSPIQVHVVFCSARTPAVAIVHDLSACKLHPENRCNGFYLRKNPLFCSVDVPVAKDSPSFARQGSRNKETPFEAYLHRVGRDDLDLVLAAEIECRFTIHQLLAGRMELLLVLLGMLLLLINPLTFRLDDLLARIFNLMFDIPTFQRP